MTTACISLIFAATLGYNYYSSRRMLEKDLESNSRNLALSLVNRVETELAAVAAVTAATASAIETGRYSGQELLALIQSAVARNPAINGAGVAFEPFAFSPDRRLYAPFFYRDMYGEALPARVGMEARTASHRERAALSARRAGRKFAPGWKCSLYPARLASRR